MLYLMYSEGMTPHVVSFDYGQKHVKELEMAAHHALRLNLEHTVVPMKHLGDFLNSALTNPETDVPEGHYAADSMKATVVPNRNMIMMSIAAGICVSIKGQMLGVGVHAGDHFVYPDCRPEFIVHMETTLKIANKGFIDDGFEIYAPFVNMGKQAIVSAAEAIRANSSDATLHLDYTKTWSCYKGLDLHCGRCGTCVERREAFQLANVLDPTEYSA